MDLIKLHKEKLMYVFFGVLTTIINIISYIILSDILQIPIFSANIIALIISILFAFVTNKIFVFESLNFNLEVLKKEMISFFGLRFISAILDISLMFIFVELLLINDIIVKIGVNILVILLNYIFSKLFIFKKE